METDSVMCSKAYNANSKGWKSPRNTTNGFDAKHSMATGDKRSYVSINNAVKIWKVEMIFFN